MHQPSDGGTARDSGGFAETVRPFGSSHTSFAEKVAPFGSESIVSNTEKHASAVAKDHASAVAQEHTGSTVKRHTEGRS